MVIGVYEGGVKLVIPPITGHQVMVGTVPDGLQQLAAGKYSLTPARIDMGPDHPYKFDPRHQIRIPKTEGLFPYYGTLAEDQMVQINLPRPSGYKPFRVVSRELTGKKCIPKYKICPIDFPMGHVLQHSWLDETAVLKGVSHGFSLSIPVSASGVFRNFHVYNEDPNGHHADYLPVLNSLFNDPDFDLDLTRADAPASVPGCSLQDFGLSAEDECDLSELPKYARKAKEDTGRQLMLATDPGSCLSYIYDECEPQAG